MKKGIFAFLLLVAALVAVWAVFFRSAPASPEVREFFGIIREVNRGGEELSLSVDELEFLSGEEAVIKGMIDTGCAREEIADCIPSLYNDHYLRNVSPETRVYRLSDAAMIETLKSPGSPGLVSSTLSEFELQYHESSLFMDKQPFHFRTDGDEIVWMEEQYTP